MKADAGPPDRVFRRRSNLRWAVRAWRLLAIVGLSSYAAHLIFEFGDASFFGRELFLALTALGALPCLARAALYREQRSAWALLGAALSAVTLAEVHFAVVLADLSPTPFPTVGDALYGGFYIASYLGIVLLLRGRATALRTSLWLDGLVAALTVSAVGATLLLHPVLMASGGGVAALAANLAYPLADSLLLALIAGLAALAGWRPGRALTLIAAGLAVSALADGLFLSLAATGRYTEGTLLDALWPVSVLLIGHAACIRDDPPEDFAIEGLRLLLLPLIFACCALGLLVLGQFRELDPLSLGLTTAALAAVLARMAWSFNENLAVLGRSRREATTDALTGLANRRKLLPDLAAALRPSSPPHTLFTFDLDGFKSYNDSFGHPAGDELLARRATALAAAASPWGTAYRLGGDEFCVLLTAGPWLPEVRTACRNALSESGEGWNVNTSTGEVHLPQDADTVGQALQLVDERLYSDKRQRKHAALEPDTDALPAR